MIDDDIDEPPPEDFEKEPVEKPSLREIWENNPPLKLVAIVLGGAILLGAYLIFSKGEETDRSRVRLQDAATAKQIPGKEQVDPAYRAALEEANKKAAEEAAKHGTSALNVPIAIPNNGGLRIPEMPEKPRSDVLEEWRRVADASRMKAAKEAIEEEPAPEVVPMVQPVRPQEQPVNPDLAKNLAAQMRVIIAAQAPVMPRNMTITPETSPYELQKKSDQARLASAGGFPGANTSIKPHGPKVIVPAGSIAYAQLLLALDSDIPGPVLAEILSGPFAGGRIMGKLSLDKDCSCLILSFSTIVKDTVSYKVDAVALDENTTLEGQATDVDNHYMERYVLPAAASFLTGYTSALSQTGQTQTATSGVGTETASAAPSPKQSIFAGLSTATQAIGNDLNQAANRPITVTLAKGTTMGIFFAETVTTQDAAQ